MRKWKFAVLPFVALLILSPVAYNVEASDVEEENSIKEEYSIYPKPHKLKYSDGTLALENEIQIVYDDTIDEATKNKVSEIFNRHNLPEPKITDKPSSNATKIYIGTHGSDGPAEQNGKKIATNEDMNFDNTDAYHLEINREGIVILGKDTDAAFYGVSTLNFILDESKDHKIRNLQIYDYANTEVRGFIEGYYGIPWSNEDRKSLMEFGGQIKTTSYIFTPKEDPYHREQWDELYPEDELAEISEMAKVGKQNKTEFVWTISPLGDVAEIAHN